MIEKKNDHEENDLEKVRERKMWLGKRRRNKKWVRKRMKNKKVIEKKKEKEESDCEKEW